jgi:hypothetical protein
MGQGDRFGPAAWVRAAAVVGRLAEQRAGLHLGHLDEQEVRRRASRQLGRPIIGDDPGLRVLLADLAQAPLTPFGRLWLRSELIRREVTSPRHGWDEVRRRPGLPDPPLWRPLVVVGLPRTGTTLLQSLLGCDPQALVLPFWQLRRPYPIPRRRLDPATRTLRAAPWPGWARSVASRLGDIHPVDQASVMAGSTVGLPTGRDHQRRRRGYGSLIASSPCDRRHQVAVVKSCGPWLPHSGGNGMGLALPRRLRARIPPPRATTICRPTPAIA